MKSWRGLSCLLKCRLLPDIFLVVLWSGALIAVHSLVQPKHLGFFCNDDTIKYPYVENTIRNDVIVGLTLAVPVVIMFFTELLTRKYLAVKRNQNGMSMAMGMGMEPQPLHREIPRVWEVIMAYLSYFWGYLVLTMIVVVLKMTTGQLRPHFLAVCRPDVDLATCQGYISSYNCTNTEMSDKFLSAARQSFPSGHAAYSMYMALFVVLYMEVRLTSCSCGLLKLTSYGMLTTYALWCGATRVSDHMHHMTDVVAGGLLGLVLAVVTFTRGALPSLQHHISYSDTSDIENNAHRHYRKTTLVHNTSTSVHNSDYEDNDDNDDEDDEDEDSLMNVETEAPTTPTRLLSVKSKKTVSRVNGLAGSASPFSLEGNRHSFARKSNSAIN